MNNLKETMKSSFTYFLFSRSTLTTSHVKTNKDGKKGLAFESLKIQERDLQKYFEFLFM